jgi:flagellar L-ring protein precursor FlgH
MRWWTFISLAAWSSVAAAQTPSLYEPASYQAFTSDLRPRKVGDLLTVAVYENASASTTANTSAGRDATVGLELRAPGKAYSRR